MTNQQDNTTIARQGSVKAPTWDREGSGLVTGQCIICNRTHKDCTLSRYSFNEPKQIVDWSDPKVFKDNDKALTIIICGTDRNLVTKIKREARELTPKEITDRAIKYRDKHPIKTRITKYGSSGLLKRRFEKDLIRRKLIDE